MAASAVLVLALAVGGGASAASAEEGCAPAAGGRPSAMSPAWLAPGRPVLTLAAADAMASRAIEEAEARGFKDVSVFVLDGGGRTLVSKTMIGCPPLPPKLAHAKASACVGMHAPSSRALRDKYVPDRTPQLLAMSLVGAGAQMPLAAFPGGVLCRDAAGNVLGAIGVSGAAADEDEHCAIVGARAVGLLTEPAESALPL